MACIPQRWAPMFGGGRVFKLIFGPICMAEGVCCSSEYPVNERRSSETGNARIIFLWLLL
ncbi:hypothetical protein BG74_06455 [Sodalis-like endosymbiont of Proechinophthirus fluctus]|nr:hypothetical protein BG74_06455 [Sodalis-like endosymbiont of Proechinophthirus fluctus]